MICRSAAGPALLLPLLLLAGPAWGLQKVYVANLSAGTVAVVDAERRQVIDRIAVGGEPDGVAAAPDGTAVYVANYADGTLSVIDPASETVVATVAVDAGPVGLAVHPDGHELYVACKTAGTLVVVDAASRAVAARIAVGEAPNDVAIAPDGSALYVARSAGASVAVVDVASRQARAPLAVGPGPNRLALAADGTRLFVTLFRAREVLRVALGDGLVDGRTSVGGKPTGLAIAADGRSLWVAQEGGGLEQLDATTLGSLADDCAAVAPYGLLALPGGRLLVADMGGNQLRLRAAGADASLPIDGGPFALAALPRADASLEVGIDAPLDGARLAAGGDLDVRVTVRPVLLGLQRWTLTLRGPAGDRRLAGGTALAVNLRVAIVPGDDLPAGADYALILEAIDADDGVIRRVTRFTVPRHAFALVPLEPTRADPYDPPALMDGSGRRFASFDAVRREVLVDHVDSGTRTVHPATRFASAALVAFSRDGTRLALEGYAESRFVDGVLDLANALFIPVPNWAAADLDAGGRRVATLSLRQPGWNYDLHELDGGAVTPITDLPTPGELPPTCRPFSAGRPRLDASGGRVAFVTAHALGGPPGCNLYVFDAHADAPRLVHSFGDAGPLDAPSMDDAGSRLAVRLPSPALGDDGAGVGALIELTDGALTPLAAAGPGAVYDVALSGDGAAAVLSSCADLDPAVGNPDHNLELFRIDLATQAVSQVTDTRGGPQGCAARGGASLQPQVSGDGLVVSHRGMGYGAPGCGQPGAQRDQLSGFAFGQTRAVPIAAGNQPPELLLPDAAVGVLGEPLLVAVAASDPDGDPLAFFAEVEGRTRLPPGARFAEGTFTWATLDPDDVGVHRLRVGAFDGRGGDDVRVVRLAVCRFRAADPIGDVVTAIFGSQPPDCGSGDANGDGRASAADLVAR